MKSTLFRLFPIVSILLPSLITIAAAPAPGTCPSLMAPGLWQGPLEENIQGHAKDIGGVGLEMMITNHLTGEINLVVTCEGGITGTITFSYQVNWDIVGVQTSGCSGSGTFAVSGGTVEDQGGLPVLALNGQTNSVETCLGESHSESSSVKMQSTEFNGDTVSSTLPFLGDLVHAGDIQASLDASPETEWTTSSSWEITRTASHIVTNVLGEYEQYFLQGLNFTNTYNITVDWQDATPGTVNLVLGEELIPASGSGTQWTAQLPVGSQPVGINDLSAVAVTPGGQASPSFPHPLIIVPMPNWAKAINMTNLPQPPAMIYRGTAHIPEEPLKYTVELPSFIPVIGGTWGLTPTQIQAAVEATSQGGLKTAPVTGTSSLALGGKSITAVIDGETRTVMSATELAFDGGQADIKVEQLSYNKQVGLLNLVPGIDQLSGSPIMGKIINALNSIISVNANVTADLSGTAQIGVKPNDTLGILSGDAKSDVTVLVVGQVGIDGLAMAFVGGGGQGILVIQIAPEVALKDCQVNLLFTAGYSVADFFGGSAGSYEGKYQLLQCSASALIGGRTLALITPMQATQLVAMPRSANWQPQSFVLQQNAATDVEETILVENASSGAAPYLAAGPDGKLAMVWIGEDAAKPRLQGLEVFYRLYDGQAWGEAQQLTSNDLFDQAPQAAFDGDGNLVVVWNQNQLTGLADDAEFDENFAANMEIAYAVITAQGEVSASGLTTDNSQLDFGAQIAASSDGNVYAGWQSSASNNLVGDATETNNLQVASWNGEAWSVSQAAEVNGTLWWQLAVKDANQALVVADQDTDGDLATGTDREIFAFSLNDADWSETQLTSNDVVDLGPHAAYAADGTLAIGWLQGEQAMGLIGDLSSPVQTWMPETTLSSNFAQARLMAGADGSWTLAWPDMADQQPEVLMATYDPAAESWTAPEVALASADQEARLSGATLADGSVVLGLMKLPVEMRALTMDDGTAIEVPGAAEQGSLAVWHVNTATEQAGEAAAGGGLPSWVLIAAVAVIAIGAAAYFLTQRKK